MIKQLGYWVLCFCFLGMISCERETKKPTYQIHATNRVLVLCEGNFQWGNADFDVFLPDSLKLYSTVFKTQNGGALGDVLQSGVLHNNSVWLVLNNSGKLVSVDPVTFKWKSEISGLVSPRFLLPIQNDTAWVTDLYSNKIRVVDLKSGTKTGSIPCNGWTEEMIKLNNTVLVASTKGRVYYFNFSGKLLDSTVVYTGCKWLGKDKNNKLWALASDSGKSFLYKINPIGKYIETKFDFQSGSYAEKICFNGFGDTLYYLNNGLFKMSIEDVALPTAPFFKEVGANYYGLAINPDNGKIYLADAKDYVSKGNIVVLNSSGSVFHRFTTGTNPTAFVFLK